MLKRTISNTEWNWPKAFDQSIPVRFSLLKQLVVTDPCQSKAIKSKPIGNKLLMLSWISDSVVLSLCRYLDLYLLGACTHVHGFVSRFVSKSLSVCVLVSVCTCVYMRSLSVTGKNSDSTFVRKMKVILVRWEEATSHDIILS